METKTETGKSSMNRGRRQLLIGAGLAPMVVTLHSAKVFGQDLNPGNPSGLAPYSGVINGSLDVNGNPGNESTEKALYEAIWADTSGKLTEYYGLVGTPSGDPLVPNSSIHAWEVGITGKYGGQTPSTWTRDYETTYIKYVTDVYDVINSIYADAANPGTTAITKLEFENRIATAKDALISKCAELNSDKGIFGWLKAAEEAWQTDFNNAYDAYVVAFNANENPEPDAGA